MLALHSCSCSYGTDVPAPAPLSEIHSSVLCIGQVGTSPPSALSQGMISCLASGGHFAQLLPGYLTIESEPSMLLSFEHSQ